MCSYMLEKPRIIFFNIYYNRNINESRTISKTDKSYRYVYGTANDVYQVVILEWTTIVWTPVAGNMSRRSATMTSDPIVI